MLQTKHENEIKPRFEPPSLFCHWSNQIDFELKPLQKQRNFNLIFLKMKQYLKVGFEPSFFLLGIEITKGIFYNQRSNIDLFICKV